MNSETYFSRYFWIIASLTVLATVCASCSDKKTVGKGVNKHSIINGDSGKTSRELSTRFGGSSPSETDHGANGISGSGAQIEVEKILRKTEPILSCKAPSEFLFLNSRNVPNAVVVVTLPLDYSSRTDKSYPLVIAFGGAGECSRPPREGAMAWLGYYRMDDAIHALTSNHLKAPDFKGLVSEQRLVEFNQKLKRHPFSGVIVACPYSPLITTLPEFENTGYEDFVMKELLPLLKHRYRVARGLVGVDGVSMGGARSMLFGLKYPEAFSSIGSIQGAFGPFLDTYRGLIRKNKNKLKNHSIQLITSDGDSMAPSVDKMKALLNDEGIPVTYMKLTGPHDYIFNQGPGSIALLMFHNLPLRQTTGGPKK